MRGPWVPGPDPPVQCSFFFTVWPHNAFGCWGGTAVTGHWSLWLFWGNGWDMSGGGEALVSVSFSPFTPEDMVWKMLGSCSNQSVLRALSNTCVLMHLICLSNSDLWSSFSWIHLPTLAHWIGTFNVTCPKPNARFLPSPDFPYLSWASPFSQLFRLKPKGTLASCCSLTPPSQTTRTSYWPDLPNISKTSFSLAHCHQPDPGRDFLPGLPQAPSDGVLLPPFPFPLCVPHSANTVTLFLPSSKLSRTSVSFKIKLESLQGFWLGLPALSSSFLTILHPGTLPLCCPRSMTGLTCPSFRVFPLLLSLLGVLLPRPTLWFHSGPGLRPLQTCLSWLAYGKGAPLPSPTLTSDIIHLFLHCLFSHYVPGSWESIWFPLYSSYRLAHSRS